MPSPFAPIPMPQTGMEAFTSGFHNAQNFFNSLAARRANEIKSQALIQEAQRKQQLLPHLIQKYADEHNLSPHHAQLMQAQAQNYLSEISERQQKAALQKKLMGELFGANNEGNNENSNISVPTREPQNPVGMSNKALVQQANQDQAAYDQAHGIEQPVAVKPQEEEEEAIVPQQSQNQMPRPEESNVSQPPPQSFEAGEETGQGGAQPSIAKQNENIAQGESALQPEKAQMGAEEVIKQGKSNLHGFDKLAGMTIAGVRIPPLKTKVVDGYEYNTYPSGKVTKTKVGPTYAEKQQQDVENFGKKEQKRADVKETTKLEDASKALVNSANIVKDLFKLLEDNPNLTGIRHGLQAQLHLSQDENLANFNTRSGDLQSELSKYATARPGVGSLKWAERVKTNIWNQTPYNKGVLKGAANKILEQFQDTKKSWESKNPGKKFPYSLPDITGIANSNKKGSEFNPTKKVKVRDTTTGEVKEMTMSEYHKLLEE